MPTTTYSSQQLPPITTGRLSYVHLAPHAARYSPALPTGCATRLHQTSNSGMAEMVESRQSYFALVASSEGDSTSAKLSLCLPIPPGLGAREKGGDACHSDTLLRWSPPGVACEPMGPTPTIMRPHSPRRARRRRGFLRACR